VHTKCSTHLLQPLLFILKVGGSEQALNHTMIDLCEIFDFHENDREYISSGM
jgi:hypothetical protein